MIKFFIPKFWYHKGMVSYSLLPFSFIYRLIIGLRKFYYHCFPGVKFPVPVIIVGNITVGGTGKTPLVIFLADLLTQCGHMPGIVSRGYGRTGSKKNPIIVASKSKADDVGDEALLISRRVQCPVIVSANRVRAARELIANHGCNIIISDDGLQHYALARYIEIVMVDAEFKFGNNFCLPAGPLREPLGRLKQVDFIVKNFNTNPSCPPLINSEYSMMLEAMVFRNVSNPNIVKAVADFRGQKIHAVAGIGIPGKFFQTLRQLGLIVIEHPFPDHHRFNKVDFLFGKKIVIMTEKDAVKCGTLAGENFWYIEVQARLDQNFVDKFLEKVGCYSATRL